jgi:hypothetical protein
MNKNKAKRKKLLGSWGRKAHKGLKIYFDFDIKKLKNWVGSNGLN